MSQFAVRKEKTDDGCILFLSGPINENSDLSKITFEESKVVYLDLSQVKHINSMGLRQWVVWVKGFKDRHHLVFRFCPRPVVDQINILQGFLPSGAVVESFFVPFSCPSCGHEEDVLLHRGRDYMEGSVDLKEGLTLDQNRPCGKCQKPMELDVVYPKYFNFLKYRRA